MNGMWDDDDGKVEEEEEKKGYLKGLVNKIKHIFQC